MPRRANISNDMFKWAQLLVKNAKTARELRTGLCIVLPKIYSASNAETARILGIGTATVARMQNRVRDQISGRVVNKAIHGGRRHQLFPIEQELAFLKPWLEKEAAGGSISVSEIHAALEEQLERKVAKSTVYRMLERNGWRKPKKKKS